jgi:hypothetical protein
MLTALKGKIALAAHAMGREMEMVARGTEHPAGRAEVSAAVVSNCRS